MPMNERLARLIDSLLKPAIAFTQDGTFAGANEPAKNFAPLLNDLSRDGLEKARDAAIADGQSLVQMDFGRVAVQRVGATAEAALIAVIDAVIVPRRQSTASPPVVIPAVRPAPEDEKLHASETAIKVAEKVEATIEPSSPVADDVMQSAIAASSDQNAATISEAPTDPVHIDGVAEFISEDDAATTIDQTVAELPAAAELNAANDTSPLVAQRATAEEPTVEHEPDSVIAADASMPDGLPIEIVRNECARLCGIEQRTGSSCRDHTGCAAGYLTTNGCASCGGYESRLSDIVADRHPAGCPRAQASPAVHVADGSGWPLFARLRRIHASDRRTHRRCFRPAVE